MFLAVDAGNTKTTLGFFEGNTITETRSFVCDKNIQPDKLEEIIKPLITGHIVEDCMIASVVDELTENLQKTLSKVVGIEPLVFSPKINYGINLKTPHPEKCGADRIANAYAASRLYKERPIIAVDSGSATTFDIVDENNNFLGGVIMPGIELQLKALGEKTSKLPLLDLQKMQNNINVISETTEEAIYAGVVIAHAQAIEGLLKMCEQKLGKKAFTVGTGGNIGFVSKYLIGRKFDVINPNLTLEGIKLIFDLNN